MSEKSHVGTGHSICPVCGVKHNEVVLLDKRLRPTLEREQTLGFEMCPEHKKLHDDGYLALVVVTYVPQGVQFIQQYNEAKRTGEVIHIRRALAMSIFTGVTITSNMKMMWIDPEGAAKIKAMMSTQGEQG